MEIFPMTLYIMGILKIASKNPLSPPYTMLPTHNITWRKFCSLFLNIVKGGRGEKQNIVQIAAFPIIFVGDCSFLAR